MAQEPEKTIAALDSYQKTVSEEEVKACEWLRKCIYAFSGNASILEIAEKTK